MSLNDLNKKINNPDAQIDSDSFYGGNRETVENKFKVEGNQEWKQNKSWLDEGMRRIVKITAMSFAGAFLLAAVAYGVFRYSQTAFSEDRVIVEIEGPSDVDSSDLVKYKIKYTNNNRAELRDVKLTVSYPENFKPEGNQNFESEGENSSRVDLGKIKSHGEGYVEISGRFYAPVDYTLIIKATLKYIPSNFSSSFQIDGQKGLNVKTSPVSISIIAPAEILSENQIDYIIKYKNTSSISFDNLRLKVVFPTGFEIKDSPISVFDGSGIWDIGKLDSGQEGETKISGIIQGVRGDVKSINATIGQSRQNQGKDLLVFEKREVVSKIVAIPLSISQIVNGQKTLNINPGEELKYELSYKNEGDVGLRDSVLTIKIDSPVLDFSNLNLFGKGSYNSKEKEIVWKAADVPQLAKLDPGQGGMVTFSIPVKGKIEISKNEDKNFQIESVAKIDSPDVTYPSVGINESVSRALVKLNSKVILETKAFYNDNNIKTSGPIPPKVGQETEYVIHWKITNVSNDIDGMTISAFLPTGAKWKNEVYPKDADIKYNERTNEIIWNAGKIGSGTGILSDPRETSFKVSIVPQENQVKSAVDLLGKTTLKAKDLFTDADIIQEVAIKNTEIMEDKSITTGGYMVVQSD